MYFRVTSNRGADAGSVTADARGFYLGNALVTFGQGELLSCSVPIELKMVRRQLVSTSGDVPFVKIRNGGSHLYIEESFGEYCHSGGLITIVNQVSGSDLEIAISEVDCTRLENINDEEIEIIVLFIGLNVLLDPRISYLYYAGSNYKISNNDLLPGPYNRSNGIRILVTKVD